MLALRCILMLGLHYPIKNIVLAQYLYVQLLDTLGHCVWTKLAQCGDLHWFGVLDLHTLNVLDYINQLFDTNFTKILVNATV